MTILKRTAYRVDTEGQLVKCKFGNVNIDMDYATALELARKMRIMARRAKMMAGDNRKDLTAMGFLSDANKDEVERQARREF